MSGGERASAWTHFAGVAVTFLPLSLGQLLSGLCLTGLLHPRSFLQQFGSLRKTSPPPTLSTCTLYLQVNHPTVHMVL